ncbi:hypothetical protein AWZ03_002217 [Drosophila navojoa]|uniref:Uncharacterized protein n=1 Tax=Drosophila navojoa TaxID=7232 RepID=A0A484BT75_DRONA|nr:hypothetical protein AWZ03_002217 [Drosophila navojoa]
MRCMPQLCGSTVCCPLAARSLLQLFSAKSSVSGSISFSISRAARKMLSASTEQQQQQQQQRQQHRG